MVKQALVIFLRLEVIKSICVNKQGATPMIPGGNNGQGGKFKAYFVDPMDKMDAVIRCGLMYILTSN